VFRLNFDVPDEDYSRAEILLKVGLKHQKSKINIYLTYCSLPVRFFFFYRHEYIAEDNTHLMLNKN
jgi:hypothetical protein